MIRTNTALLLSLVLLATQNMTSAQNPVIIAHRGASGYLPEHTLPAATLAHAQGADYIEQDTVLTKDNVPIVLHDVHLDTVTDVATKFPQRNRPDGRFYAIDFSLAEIKQLNVQERINLKTGQAVFPNRFPVGKSAFKIPTLAEEIELIQGLNHSSKKEVGVYVEIKAPAWHRMQGKDISSLVLAELERYGYTQEYDNAFVQCFDPNELKRIKKELKCHLKLVQLIGENSWESGQFDYDRMRTKAGLKEVSEYADGIGPRISHVLLPKLVEPQNELQLDSGSILKINPIRLFKLVQHTKLVESAHELDLVVHAYTFRSDAKIMLDLDYRDLVGNAENSRLDGIFTDFPDETIQALKNLYSSLLTKPLWMQ